MTRGSMPGGVPDEVSGTGQVPATPAGRPLLPGRGGGLIGTGRPVVTIAMYDDYESAQRAVDYLSDQGFPVDRTVIVGTDLRLVEKVLGRMTTGRAALAGAASGGWFGLLIGLLLAIFGVSTWWRVVLIALVIGAVWGAVFGAMAHAVTGGRRDFVSRSTLQASQYAVDVDAEHADAARQLLTRLNWRTSGAG